MAKVPAYFTIAFGLDGKVNIQQIQYREVVEIDGELIQAKMYPVELISAPHHGDLLNGSIQDAIGAISTGHVLAVAAAEAERDAAVAQAEADKVEATRAAKAERDEAVAKFEAVNGVTLEALQAQLDAKDANLQVLMAQKAELEAAVK